jgi:hypothetical protein
MRPTLAYVEDKIQKLDKRIEHHQKVLDGRSEASFTSEELEEREHNRLQPGEPEYINLTDYTDPNNQVNNLLPTVMVDIPLLRIISIIYSLYKMNLFSLTYNQLVCYFNSHKSVTPYILIGLSFLFIMFFSFDFSVISCDAPRA